jgi:hypothetical protein
MSRTIVKASIKTVSRARPGDTKKALRAHVDYAQRRPNRDGHEQSRTVFSRDQNSLEHQETREAIQQMEGSQAYTLVLSPDPDQPLEPHQMQAWTRSMMDEIERTHGSTNWVAVVHDDQVARTTEHPHVHVVMQCEERLTREELAALREHGDLEQHRLHQLEQSRFLEPTEPSLDASLERHQDRDREPEMGVA